MTDVDGQIHREFERIGLETSDITYNDDLDRWRVSVTAEGSDDRYLVDVTEIGADGPVDLKLDFPMVRGHLARLDGVSIPAGTISVEGTESGDVLITVD